MLVSHLKRFIFLKTVKTGGTSIEIYLEPFCRNDDQVPTHQTPGHVSEAGIVGTRPHVPQGMKYFNHMPAAAVRAELGRSVWQSYLKISCIRDPFDKVVSAFWMTHRQTPIDLPVVRDAFRTYVLSSVLPVDRAIYTIDGELCCDIVIRYETLSRDLAAVCEQLRLPFEPARLGRYKSHLRPASIPLAAYYDQDTIARVRQLFDQEFAWFGYASEPGDRASPPEPETSSAPPTHDL